MTDKQIIIDGVDVSGCEYYDKNKLLLTCICEEYPCSECHNCNYKQLKRKEQECEKWQVELAYKASELQNIEEKIKPLMKRPDDLDYYDLEWIVWAFANEFKQLKAENEELNKEVQYLKSEIERISK